MGGNNTNTINNFKIPHKKITSPLLTKGVPLLYNVGIMNKTITTTNKSLNTKYKPKSYKSYEDYKSKTKNQPQPEDDVLVSIIGTLVSMVLAAVLFFGVIHPITSTPFWGAKLLFVILGGWILFLFKGFGGGV